MSYFKDAKVGDRVIADGIDGKILHTFFCKDYPILVDFSNGARCSFTMNGNHVLGVKQTLFYKEEKTMELKHDDIVLVWFNDKSYAERRYFKEYLDKSIVCYDGGCSSKTIKDKSNCTEWKHYQILDQQTLEPLVKQYPVDTKVIVTINGKEYNRYLNNVNLDNSVSVFTDGRTSWTGIDTVKYDKWRLAE